MKFSFAHNNFNVVNLEKSLKFYEEALGLKEIRRKEAKDHGDAGILLGSGIKDGDRVVMIEDVTTSGKSMEETVPIVKAQGNVTIVGLMVSLNRMEVGLGGSLSALDEIQESYGFPARAIVSMAEVTEALYNQPVAGEVLINDELKAQIDEYYKQYGVKQL